MKKFYAFLGRRVRRFALPHFDIIDLVRRPSVETLPAIRALTRAVYVGGNIVLCRVLGKYKMYVDSQDISLSSHLMIDGVWEFWVTGAMTQLVKPGMVAVDIGANLGYFTLLLADLVRPNGRVHAFEPNPAIAALLKRNVIVNGFTDHVTVHVRALGDGTADSYQLVVPANYPGGAWVKALAEDDPRGQRIEVRRLDTFKQIEQADFIKIDAEAAEETIWDGMSGLLARGRPLIVFLEFAACRYADPAGFLDKIAAAGFSFAYTPVEGGIVETSAAEVLGWPPTVEVMLILRR